jgi:HSP20 family protein
MLYKSLFFKELRLKLQTRFFLARRLFFFLSAYLKSQNGRTIIFVEDKTMLLTRRLPFWDVERMFDEMSQMFGEPLGLRSVPAGAFPGLNVYDAKDKLVVTAEIPGVDPAKLELTVQENSLTLTGERNDDAADENVRFYRKERPSGQFSRTITLSENVDPAGVKASSKNGILTIELPKAQAAKSRTVTIQTE